MLIRFLFIFLFTFNALAAYQPITTVSGSVLVGNDSSVPVPVNIVSGTVNVNTTGLATSALQTTGNASLSNIDGSTATMALGMSASGTSVPFYSYFMAGSDGTKAHNIKTDTAGVLQTNVLNFPATQAVTGTFWQSTQPVSIASMPTTPVTGTFWQTTQPVSIASTLVVSATGNSTVNQGTSPWVTSISNQPVFSLGAVSTTTALNVANATATNLKVQGENYQNGSAVGGTNPLFVSIAAVSTSTALPVTFSAASFSLSGVSTTASLNTASTQSGVWANSISGVSTTSALPVTFSGASFSIGGVSTTSALNVANATATNLKAQAEQYQGGTAVGGANPLYVSIGAVSTSTALPVTFSAASFSLSGVSTTASINTAATQSGAWGQSITGVSTTSQLLVSIGAVSSTAQFNGAITGVSTTSILNVSGTVALNPNQTVLTTPNTIASSSSTGRVTLSGSSFSFLTANASRKSLELMNTSDVTCWAKKGTTATSSTGIVLLPYSSYYNFVQPVYTGAIDVICSGVNTTGALMAVEE